MALDINLIEEGLLAPPISESGSIVSFNAPVPLTVSELNVNIAPVQSGSGDPSPTNIRPITGWTGANVHVNRENWLALVDGTSFTLKDMTYSVVDGALHISGTSTGETSSTDATFKNNLSFFLPAGTYYFTRGDAFLATYLKGTVNGSDITLATNSGTFTLAETTKVWIAFYVYNVTTTDRIINAQVARGSSALAYAPYRGITYPISFGSAGTVYGGTLDVLSGKLTVTHKYYKYNDIQLTDGTTVSAGYRVSFACPSDDINRGKWSSVIVPTFSMLKNNGGLQLYGISKGYSANAYTTIVEASDITEAKAILEGLEICYGLVTPIEYDLTPTQVQTLVGQNNVWTDCGDIASLKTALVLGKLKIRLMEEGISINGTSPLLRSASSPNTEEDTLTKSEPIGEVVKEPIKDIDEEPSMGTVKELPEDETEPEPEDEEVTEDDNEG